MVERRTSCASELDDFSQVRCAGIVEAAELVKEPAMSKPNETDKVSALTASSASGADLRGRTLLPMLVAGLILIVVGMLVVVVFVV